MAVAAVPLRAEYVDPSRRTVSLAEIHQADRILIVQVSEPIRQGPAEVAPLRHLPVRERLYGGGRLKAVALKSLKGPEHAGGTALDLPLGPLPLEAEPHDQCLLLVRDQDGKPWISRLAWPAGDPGPDRRKRTKETGAGPSAGTGSSSGRRLPPAVVTPLVYRIELASQALALPSREAAATWLGRKRDSFVATFGGPEGRPAMRPHQLPFFNVINDLHFAVAAPDPPPPPAAGLMPDWRDFDPPPDEAVLSAIIQELLALAPAQEEPAPERRKRQMERELAIGDIGEKTRLALRYADRPTVDRLWEILATEGETSKLGGALGEAFGYSRRPLVRQKIEDYWREEAGTVLDLVAVNNLIYMAPGDAEAKLGLACEAVRDPRRHPLARGVAAQYLARRQTRDPAAGDAMYAAMKNVNFSGKTARRSALSCEVGMLPECFVEVLASARHPRGIAWILEFEDRIPAGVVVRGLPRLDPALHDRRVVERLARHACLAGGDAGRDARAYLDRVFGRLFFSADSDAAELAAWLEAFDAGTLDRSNGEHWVWHLPPVR